MGSPQQSRGTRTPGGDLTCVPVVAAAPPGQVDSEAAEEVEEGPGQDDNVVDVEEDDDHLGGVADAWGGGGAAGWAGGGTRFTRPAHPCLGQGMLLGQRPKTGSVGTARAPQPHLPRRLSTPAAQPWLPGQAHLY